MLRALSNDLEVGKVEKNNKKKVGSSINDVTIEGKKDWKLEMPMESNVLEKIVYFDSQKVEDENFDFPHCPFEPPVN